MYILHGCPEAHSLRILNHSSSDLHHSGACSARTSQPTGEFAYREADAMTARRNWGGQRGFPWGDRVAQRPEVDGGVLELLRHSGRRAAGQKIGCGMPMRRVPCTLFEGLDRKAVREGEERGPNRAHGAWGEGQACYR
jgi:hypothetical protein